MDRYALLFPGQGSQYIGMGKSSYTKYPFVREIFAEASDILGFNVPELCFSGDIEALSQTENTQPALLVTSIALFRAFMEEVNKTPTYAAGHSLGEIAALTCAGAIVFKDAVNIVRARGRLMQQTVPDGQGTMFAVSGVNREIVEQCLREFHASNNVLIANINAPDQFVLSGYTEATTEIANELQKRGARSIKLKVSAPFHSPLMSAAASKFRQELQKYTYHPFCFPVIESMLGAPYKADCTLVESLAQQIVRPVQWQQSMQFLDEQKITTFVEIGPKSVLKNLVKKNIPAATALSYDTKKDSALLQHLFSDTGNAQPQETVIDTIIKKCLVEAVCTKNNNWDEEAYQKGVILPYKKIQNIQNTLKSKNSDKYDEEYAKEALKLLKVIMETKMVPLSEQEERMRGIMPGSMRAR